MMRRVEKKMNKQRKVLITITYNEMGIIIDTKAEEVARPNLQPTCNNLATDAISRQAAIDAAKRESTQEGSYGYMDTKSIIDMLEDLPSAQPEPRWILCSEKIPEKSMMCLVTLVDDKGPFVEIAFWNNTFGGRWQPYFEDVVAWMPRPEPYREKITTMYTTKYEEEKDERPYKQTGGDRCN